MSWFKLPDDARVWTARPRWDGFGYEVRQFKIGDSRFVGSRMLATSLESARALLPRKLVVEVALCPATETTQLYAYEARKLFDGMSPAARVETVLELLDGPRDANGERTAPMITRAQAARLLDVPELTDGE